MTSKEFTIWLKGFITACNDYAPTPKQWDIIKEELEKVSDKTGNHIGENGIGTPNIAPIISNPFITPPPPYDPYNPYKITCTPGTTSPGFQVTTTPGTTGFITIANPNIASFGTGSTGILNTHNPSTSITYGYPSGSAWSYTNATQPYSTYDDDSVNPNKKITPCVGHELKSQKEEKRISKKRKAKSVKEWEEEIDLGGAE
jgi:hypothetical protein